MRIFSLEIGRLVLAILVVSLHSRAASDISVISSALLNDGIARLAVPFFFTLTGFFLSPILDVGFKKWGLRVLGLYFVWSLICAPIWIIGGFSQVGLIKNIFVGYYHLWYLSALLVGGGVLFVFRRASGRSLVALALGLFAVACFGELYLRAGLPFFGLPEHLAILPFRNGIFFGFPFLVLGLVIARNRALIDEMPLKTVVLIGASALVLYLVEVSANLAAFELKGPHDCYFSAALAVPALLLALYRTSSRRIGGALGQMATGIFLVHAPILATLTLAAPSLTETYAFAATLAISTALLPLLFALNKRLLVL